MNHCWFSYTASERRGYAIYTNNLNKYVKCTCVTSNIQNPYPDSLEDVKYIGEVKDFVSHSEPSQHKNEIRMIDLRKRKLHA